MRAAADWIYGIVVVLLLSSVALQAVPKGAWQQYVKLFCGGVLILAVMKPLLALGGMSGQTALYYQRDTLSSLLQGIVVEGGRGQEEWLTEVEKRQQETMQKPLEALTESYGFELQAYSLQWKGEAQLDGIILTVRQKATEEKEAEGAAAGSAAGDAAGNTASGAGGIVPVEPVEPIEQAGQGLDGQQPEGLASSQDGTSAAEPVYYEPSELRALHQALETVLELSCEQVVIYLQREDIHE